MEELKKQLLDICNKSDLPLEAILFVTKDLWRDVDDTLRRYKQQKTLTQTKEEVEEEN